MNALSLISELSDLGISVIVDGPDLNLDAPKGALTPRLVACTREDKQDVITCLDRLRIELGEDWEEFSGDPAKLRAVADSLMTDMQRKWGVTPAHYTVTVHCETCNQNVPHFPMDANTVLACVWCLNGQAVPVTDKQLSKDLCR